MNNSDLFASTKLSQKLLEWANKIKPFPLRVH